MASFEISASKIFCPFSDVCVCLHATIQHLSEIELRAACVIQTFLTQLLS